MSRLLGRSIAALLMTLFALQAQATGWHHGHDGLAELQRTVASLEYRKGLVEDAQDVKRLQRALGYYFDKALWDEVADLFTDDGTIELGLDGVYIGRERVREYLYTLGGGQSGLREGQLNETFQLMPVISVDPSGQTAKGRWRAILMLGQYGVKAQWGEGQYENEYQKVGGVWKIKKLHWFQTFVIPYESAGWHKAVDANQGIWVSNVLPPDAPTTFPYQPWPGTHLPPFHFPNPVSNPTPAPQAPALDPRCDHSLPALARRAAILADELQALQDEQEIEKLQRIYGYYIDKGFWTEAASLFADRGTIEVGQSGVFVGKDRVRQYLQSLGNELPQADRLNDQMQLQPVIHVAEDGRTAKGRWHVFSQEAIWHQYGNWRVAVMENTYVKEDGVWKIKKLHQYTTMRTPYTDGWGKTALEDDPRTLQPDRRTSVAYAPYPAVFTPPFHYDNPVTGYHHRRPRADLEDLFEILFTSPRELERKLESLDRTVTRLEDVNAVERLEGIYGYYLASNEWDNFAATFAPDGTIEIALRGVYIGRASVRRHLDLYGAAGMAYGFLHNHMQFQPVINIAEDGLSAKMRSRAFSMIATYNAASLWMGGIYENEFVKIDGVWQIKVDRQVNTYFSLYGSGWKDMAPRYPPGVSATIPPDAPPTAKFDLYPIGAYLPAYHYANPITGNQVVWP